MGVSEGKKSILKAVYGASSKASRGAILQLASSVVIGIAGKSNLSLSPPANLLTEI